MGSLSVPVCETSEVDLTRVRDALESHSTPFIRTDFTDDAAWQTVVTELTRPVDFDDPDNRDPGDDGYTPTVTVIDDRAFDGLIAADLGAAFAASDDVFGYALLADARSMTEALAGGELTVDYVDLSVADPEDARLFSSFPGRHFRCVVPEVPSIEVNLSLGNMDFHEFADNTDPDGVFRGFDEDG